MKIVSKQNFVVELSLDELIAIRNALGATSYEYRATNLKLTKEQNQASWLLFLNLESLLKFAGE